MPLKDQLMLLGDRARRALAVTTPNLYLEHIGMKDVFIHSDNTCSNITAGNKIVIQPAPYGKELFWGGDTCTRCIKGIENIRHEFAWWEDEDSPYIDLTNAPGCARILMDIKREWYASLTLPEQEAFDGVYALIMAKVAEERTDAEKLFGGSFTAKEDGALALCLIDPKNFATPAISVFVSMDATPVYQKDDTGLYLTSLAGAQFIWDTHVRETTERLLDINTRHGLHYPIPSRPYCNLSEKPEVASPVWETVFTLCVKDGMSITDAYFTALAL